MSGRGIAQCRPPGAFSVGPPRKGEGAKGLGIGKVEVRKAQGGGKGRQWFRS